MRVNGVCCLHYLLYVSCFVLLKLYVLFLYKIITFLCSLLVFFLSNMYNNLSKNQLQCSSNWQFFFKFTVTPRQWMSFFNTIDSELPRFFKWINANGVDFERTENDYLNLLNGGSLIMPSFKDSGIYQLVRTLETARKDKINVVLHVKGTYDLSHNFNYIIGWSSSFLGKTIFGDGFRFQIFFKNLQTFIH